MYRTALTTAKYALLLALAEAGLLTQESLQQQAEYAKRDALRLPESERPAFLDSITNICTDIVEIDRVRGGEKGLVVPTF